MPDWNKIHEQLSDFLKTYDTMGKRMGICNCNVCVTERRERASIAIRDLLIDTFGGQLWIFSMNFSDLKTVAKSHGVQLHGSRDKLTLEFFQYVAAQNIERERKIPNRKITQCHCCGVLINVKYQNKFKQKHGDEIIVCKNCLGAGETCHVCGTFQLRSQMHYGQFRIDGDIKRKVMCRDCLEHYTQCPVCGVHDSHDKFKRIALPGAGVRNVCATCRDTQMGVCNICGIQIWLNNRKTEVCDDCHEYTRPLNNYHFKPNPLFTVHAKAERVDKGQLFFGAELEIERLKAAAPSYKSMAVLVKELFEPRFVYCKPDSSLKDGFEVVTQPFSWMWLKNNLDLWKRFFNFIEEHGYGTRPTAGMHLHLSKDAFTTWHLYKFVHFFYRKQTRSMMANISQRPNLEKSRHCRFDKIDVENTKTVAKRKMNLCVDPHHTAVNLKPENTIEVRIFQMPGCFGDFMKNMEYTYAIYNFTKVSRPSDMYAGKFLEFLKQKNNAGMYRNLISFIQNNPNFSNHFKSLLR